MEETEAPPCGFADCGSSAVGSRAVRGTVWFATQSRQSPANGEEAHWELGGYIQPVPVICSIHVCEHHNYSEQEVLNLD